MLSLPVNRDYFFERRLLKNCFAKDKAAQTKFAMLSYLSTIYQTVKEMNIELGSPLDDDELRELQLGLTLRAYQAHATLPDWRKDLKVQLRMFAEGAVLEYLGKLCEE